MERSLLIGIAIVLALIAILYVINALLRFYPGRNELLEMLVIAFWVLHLLELHSLCMLVSRKKKDQKKSLIDMFENSNKDALNTIIEIKNYFIESKEIINLEVEGLTIGEFDKGYVFLNLGNDKYLYATDETLPEHDKHKIYYNKNSSMIIFDEKPERED